METETRRLGVEQALRLGPGEAHYRAFVGPPARYDALSALQFAILAALDLRDSDTVLDVGCGSLRLGRLLIPYLQSGRYFGIDPNRWLIDDGIERELGKDIVSTKKPSFSFNDDFRCDGFGRKFNFVIAQSVLTHTGLGSARDLCSSIASVLESGGLAVVNWLVGAEDGGEVRTNAWLYPECQVYSDTTISQIYEDAELFSLKTSWWHPGGVRWDLLATNAAALPSDVEARRFSFQPVQRG